MRLAVSTLSCPTWSFPQIVGAAAAHGVSGIDLRGIGAEIDATRLPLFDGELEATKELLGRHGLKMPCLNTSIALVTPASERWEMMLEECRRHARVAGRVGAPYLRVFGGAVPKGLTRNEAVSMGQRHLRQLAKLCHAHNCLPLLETHDEWSTSGQVMEILGGFEPEDAAALWDIEHPVRRGETPEQTGQALGRYAKHVHLKDSVRLNGKSEPRLLGDGDLPLKEILHALRDMKYDGWLCLETEKRS